MRHPNQRRETQLRELNTQSWAHKHTHFNQKVSYYRRIYMWRFHPFQAIYSFGQKVFNLFFSFSFRFLYSDIIRIWISLHCMAQITQNIEIAFTNSVSHKQIKTFWWVSRYCVSILIDAAQAQCFFAPLTFWKKEGYCRCVEKTKTKTTKACAHKPFFSSSNIDFGVFSVSMEPARARLFVCSHD